ncbi:MAG: GNAT family N-acetyltransferase [Kofleriaceae bacterium]
MTLTIRTISNDEAPAFREALMCTFGEDADDADPGGTARFQAMVAPGRAWAAFDGANVVGTAATYDHAIGLPGGGTLPIAGLTMVTVRPTHRRRGILRELMRLHLEEARGRHVPVSGLWSSEAQIYQRFGYGLASAHDAIEVHVTPSVRFADSWADSATDELELVDEARARERLPAIYARATANRPGALRRSDLWWSERRFLETPFQRRGASRRRHVIARRGQEDVGYVAYRQRAKFTDGLPDGSVEIIELHATDARSEVSLWKFALSIDLFPNVTWWCAPVDCPLPWMLADWRRPQRRRFDNLWLRIEDISAAFAARGYPQDGRLRFAVDGATWELVVADGKGRCSRTADTPQLTFDRSTLGSLYLGGTPASTLASADLVRGDAAAIATADFLFGSSVAPWCPEVF